MFFPAQLSPNLLVDEEENIPDTEENNSYKDLPKEEKINTKD
jgi:hypothetical protein